MGNTRSEFFEPVSVDLWWNNDQANASEPGVVQVNQQTIKQANEEKMAEIHQEISSLHDKRLRLIAEKKKEMDGLRQELARHKKQNEELQDFIREKGYEPPLQEWNTTKVDVSLQTDTFEVPGISNQQDPNTKTAELELELEELQTIKGKNRQLQINIAGLQNELQNANAELEAFETERKEYKTHVAALKDIITVSKQLLLMRESQIKQLTEKVDEIQASLAEKELQTFSEDLRQEYEKQLQNIKQLRALYEERQRADKTQSDNLKSQLEDAQASLKNRETKNGELQERVDELEKDNSTKYDTLISLESQLGLTKAECAELRTEMSVINQLFSQILLDFNNGQEIDMDKLIKSLEENHDLLTEIVINEVSNELSSALPKVLLDLVTQVNETTKANPQEETNSEQGLALSTIAEESESQTSTQQNSLSSASEIVQNLPKVWKVLTELLSHQSAPVSVLNESEEQGDTNPCYKSVQTPAGPTMVLSVSKTYIRLKDLIVEKKSLEKETTRLKQLNTHLETRLQDQEKRLEMVSHELSKTWHVVGKMQKQHQQLHTQEKILRYELAQKRKLLNELKEELEYCREKWLQAKEKNSTTEEQWKQLRNEFAARKNTVSEDLNNSVESGYSDERESSSDDEIEDEAESPVGVSSEPVAGCSSATENCETSNEVASDLSTEEENGHNILKVVKEEIANIESSAALSEERESANDETGNDLDSQELISIEDGALATSNCPLILETNQYIADASLELNIASTAESTDVDGLNLEETYDSVSPLPEDAAFTPEIEASPLSSPDVVTEVSTPSSAVQQISETTTEESDSVPFNQQNETALEASSNAAVDENEEMTLKTDSVQNQEVQKTQEEILAGREARLQRLEAQAKDLITRTTNTSNRSVEFCTKLDDLHEQYGGDTTTRRKDIDDMYKRLEEDILQTIKKTQGGEEYPSTSRQTNSTEQALAAREERLKRLEEESSAVIDHAARTSHRGNEMSSKLDSLHTQYSESSSKCQEKSEETVCNVDEEPSTSSEMTSEEILARREERLQRMEEQAQQLISKARKNSLRNVQFCSKLNKLHDKYREGSDSSDDGADDNNNDNTVADGVQNEDDAEVVNNEAQLGLEEAGDVQRPEEEQS